jgi:hypothetical protein
MPIESARDPRATLMREKYFTMRPKPLERWVWKQGLPASAERVYWYHWDLGAQNGTWCSQVPLRIVARDCCLDPATVTRAYQLLKRLALVRRADPGRDPRNPFQQATAVTEVRVPRELVVELGREPNRRARPLASAETASSLHQPGSPGPLAGGILPVRPERAEARALGREESKQAFARLSAGERTRFAAASTHRRASVEFDADTRLSPTDRAHVLATLESLARVRPVATAVRSGAPVRPRQLNALELIRLDRSLHTLAAARGEALPAELLRQIAFAVEEGALQRFAVPLALNIALKKVREGAWSSPSRMPPDWRLRRALPETCMAAGGI